MERDDHEDIAVPTTRRKIPQAGAGSLLRVDPVATVAVQLLMSGRRPLLNGDTPIRRRNRPWRAVHENL